MVENIYHLESKRVENSVFSQETGGENGILSKNRRSEDFGIFSNSMATFDFLSSLLQFLKYKLY